MGWINNYCRTNPLDPIIIAAKRLKASLANGKSMPWSGEYPILGCAGRPASSLYGCGSDHIVSRQWPPDPLQLELTDGLNLYGVLDLHQHSRADEDLSRLGLIAQPRGDVRHRADGGVVKPALEADSAERSEAVRYADAKANLVPEAAPGRGQSSQSVTHFKGHEHRLQRWVLHWHRIVEDHHHPVASVPFERAVVLDDDFADGGMVIAQQSHDVFRIGAFSEPGEAAQIAEERGNLPDIQTTARSDHEKDASISGLHVQLTDAQAQLKDARGQLKDARGQLTDAQEQLTDARGQLKDARGQLTNAREKIVTSTLLSAGFDSVEIEIETSPGGQVNEGWTYTFVFEGSGRPWGFIAGSNYLLMHAFGPALDNIQGGMPFRLTETTLVPNPDTYMAPTAYVAHEIRTSYRATASDAYIPEQSAYGVQLGHRDVFGVKDVVVKITHPGAREGEVFTLNKLSISVNGAPPIKLVEHPNTKVTIGEPDTHLGQPMAGIGRPLPDHWLGSGE